MLPMTEPVFAFITDDCCWSNSVDQRSQRIAESRSRERIVAQVTLARFGRLAVTNFPRSLSAHRTEIVAATRELPAFGYAIEVDGRLKAEFATRDGARAGGEE